MSSLEIKAVEMLDKLDSVLTSYTPAVKDAAVEVVRISAIGDLLFSFIILTVAVFLVRYYLKNKAELDAKVSSCDDFLPFMLVIASLVIALIFFVVSLTNAIDIWNYVAIFNPELALAHKILF